MNFYEYQDKSRDTWLFNYNQDELRAVLGASGEVGEISEKYKKKLRGDKRYSGQEGKFVFCAEIMKEIGDVLYYLARLCDYNGLSMEEVAKFNIEKLQSRKKRNQIKGSGDNR